MTPEVTKIAKSFGVAQPFLEHIDELMKHKGKTNFHWLKSLSDTWYLVIKTRHQTKTAYINCNHSKNHEITKSLLTEWKVVIPAPQLHEINKTETK